MFDGFYWFQPQTLQAGVLRPCCPLRSKPRPYPEAAGPFTVSFLCQGGAGPIAVAPPVWAPRLAAACAVPPLQEIAVIRGALDLTSKTAARSMTPLDKVGSLSRMLSDVGNKAMGHQLTHNKSSDPGWVFAVF